ncbi:hypothetical protein AMECASPLE_022910 [Ameca splendens]|uniref:PDZ domain-containing protein n=1 Tax=Ameca splendens TaxID=208324 RepID=A0ABV0Z291_9TELE
MFLRHREYKHKHMHVFCKGMGLGGGSHREGILLIFPVPGLTSPCLEIPQQHGTDSHTPNTWQTRRSGQTSKRKNGSFVIEDGGKAAHCKRLKVGDELININGSALYGSRQEALILIKGSYRILKLTVRR